MNKTLYVDSNCLCWINFHKLGHLSYDDRPTGIIFGFLKQLLSIKKELKNNRFVFCFDSKINYRKDIYSLYKANRKKDIDETTIQSINNQINLLKKKILKKLGFKNIIYKNGYESDDFLYLYSLNEFNKEKDTDLARRNNVLVTTDHDLWQSLFHCDIYNPNTHEILTWEWFRDNHNGFHSSKFAEVKALAGCTSDNVKGIEGVGEIKAWKYLYGELKQGKIYDRIVSKKGRKIYHRNLKLVKLPFEKKDDKLEEIEILDDELYAENFIDVFQQYDFKSFIKNINEWKKEFNLK